MKKLLSLLSILIISGTTIPITIAASIYQKEKYNKENLIINKRVINFLIFGLVQQKNNFWFESVVVKAVLRFSNINLQDIFIQENFDIINKYIIQVCLENLVHTEIQNTISNNLLKILNTIINRYLDLNSHNFNWFRVFYQIIILFLEYNILREFYNFVSESLNNNISVILGFTGILPGWIECKNQDNHYIIIYEITKVNKNNNFYSFNYTYIDPVSWLNRGTFIGNDLTNDLTQGRNNNVLLHYDFNVVSINWNNNKNSLQNLKKEINFNFVDINYEVNSKASQKEKRSNENKIQCITKKYFYFDEKNKSDQKIEKYYNKYNHCKISNLKLFTFNFKNINLLSFKKIEILFDNIYNIYTKININNDNNYNKTSGIKISDFFKNKNIKDIIKNIKVNNNNNKNKINIYSNNFLIKWNLYNFYSYQKINLTFYWEKNNYYLQLLMFKYSINNIILNDGGIVSVCVLVKENRFIQ